MATNDAITQPQGGRSKPIRQRLGDVVDDFGLSLEHLNGFVRLVHGVAMELAKAAKDSNSVNSLLSLDFAILERLAVLNQQNDLLCALHEEIPEESERVRSDAAGSLQLEVAHLKEFMRLIHQAIADIETPLDAGPAISLCWALDEKIKAVDGHVDAMFCVRRESGRAASARD